MNNATVDPASLRRWNVGRDVTAAALLLLALVLPWNVHFGVGVPDSPSWLFDVLVAVTVLSWVAHAHTYLGQRGQRAAHQPVGNTVRAALNGPYLLVVAAFVGFAVIEVIRDGGSGDIPAGVGPGLLAGLAGALLAAQPTLLGQDVDTVRLSRWFAAARVSGLVGMGLAVAAVIFNLYWRTHLVLPDIADPDKGKRSVAVIATAVVYGAVPLVVVVSGLRWLTTKTRPAQLATVALGVSVVLGTALVWLIGVGRDIDAFHGIAQSTSTASVGFEAYLVWVGAAAIYAPLALRQAFTRPLAKADWQNAARKCLALAAIWCAGAALLRIFDLVSAISLNLPYSPYDSMALLGFDVIAAVAAVWIRLNLTSAVLHPAVIAAGSGLLFVLALCRIAVGVGLAPRILYTAMPDGFDGTVYGNNLAQQITSTFDVVICWLVLAVVIFVVVPHISRLSKVRSAVSATAVPDELAPETTTYLPAGAPTPSPADISDDTTTHFATASTDVWNRNAEVPTIASALPKIARPGQTAAIQQISDRPSQAGSTQSLPRIARVLEESTQRFGAGTTYTGTGRKDDSVATREDERRA